LREAPVPVDPEAEERGLEVVLAAYAERAPRRPTTSFPRLAIAFAVAALLAALLLSPAGASVRGWVGDVFSEAPAPSHIGLTAIPSGGRLLVQGAAGPWVVEADGSRHRLGDYDEASWSPRGLYVATASGRHLAAVAPDGTVQWSLTAPATVRDPRWSPPSPAGVFVAYRAGAGLRIVAGDGSEERPLDESVAPLAPTWSPIARPADLAYVDARGALRVIDVESGREAARGKALPGIAWLEWGGFHAGAMLEASPQRMRIRAVGVETSDIVGLGEPRSFHLPAGETVEDAALSPNGRKVAALLAGRFGGVRRTDVMLFDVRHRRSVRLLSVPGRLTELAWAPDGSRLLIGWPRFDEWLFLPTHFATGQAVTGISQAFAPSGDAAAPFPRVEGWCCRFDRADAG
jgi:hypothetical protein